MVQYNTSTSTLGIKLRKAQGSLYVSLELLVGGRRVEVDVETRAGGEEERGLFEVDFETVPYLVRDRKGLY